MAAGGDTVARLVRWWCEVGCGHRSDVGASRGDDDATSATASKASQHTDLREGLASGCLAAGITKIARGKVDTELAFRHAWRRWPHARAFPAVSAGPHRDDLLHILNASKGRCSAHLSGWSSQWSFTPYINEHWDIQDVADLLAHTTGAALAGWVDQRAPSSTDSPRSRARSPA